jgi:hypothetical protein
MNFLGLSVRDLDTAEFLSTGRALYAAAYLTWVLLLLRARRIGSVWVVITFAILSWFLTTYPLQRLYGLEAGTDRQRNLSWCATAAAGNAPWESGVVGKNNLEPAWAFLVSLISFFDPARVMRVYPFLPAVAIALVGISFFYSFKKRPDLESPDRDTERLLSGLLVVFLILLAPTGPLDYLTPYRSFWQRTFLLKPNHALAWALVPLFVTLVAGRPSLRRSAAAAIVLGALGWAFIVHWALTCGGVALYVALGWFRRVDRWKAESVRLVAILLISLVVVAPYLWYLVQGFPVVSFPTGSFPDNPQMSVWGDSPARTHSLFFLATLDLGPTFFLACFGFWTCWTIGNRFGLLWGGLLIGAYAAWAANSVLLSAGQARQTDEIYFFLTVMAAVLAAFGLVELMRRLLSVTTEITVPGFGWNWPRATSLVLLLWFPLTLPWWWRSEEMDPHFRLSLEPVPERLTTLGEWIREHSDGKDTFFAGADVAVWIPALTGRRVLRTGMPWSGSEAHSSERALLFPESEGEGRAALGQLQVDYVILDRSLRSEHGLEPDHFDRLPWLEQVFQVADINVYRSQREYGPPVERTPRSPR